MYLVGAHIHDWSRAHTGVWCSGDIHTSEETVQVGGPTTGQGGVIPGVDGRRGLTQAQVVVEGAEDIVGAVGVNKLRTEFQNVVAGCPGGTTLMHQAVADGGHAAVAIDLGTLRSGIAPQDGIGQSRASARSSGLVT